MTLMYDWEQWTMHCNLTAQSEDIDHFERMIEIALEVSESVDSACSRFRIDSELVVRADDFSHGAQPSPLLEQLITTALKAANFTNGMVDPTLGSRLIELGYDQAFDSVANAHGIPAGPSTQQTGANRVHFPYSWMDLTLENHVLTVPPGMIVDLGATAKAFTADLIAARCFSETGSGVLVSLGGDVATAGPAPLGGWQVQLFDDSLSLVQSLTLEPGWAVATSSTRMRRWMLDEEPVHHILDPATGMPASHQWSQVSVVAPSCVEANVLATAAIVCGADAKSWLESKSLVRASLLIGTDGSQVRIGGWPRSLPSE